VVRAGCGEQHDLVIGIAEPSTDYNVYITNLINGVTRVFMITSQSDGDLIFDLVSNFAFLTGQKYRIVVIEDGEEEPAELRFEDDTTFTCIHIEFKNLYDSNGNLDAPIRQWLIPY
jgi:flagellar assembly factor FliW